VVSKKLWALRGDVALARKIPVAMTIAGVDSGGGAGIAADLKTFAALGVHGTVAVTSVTAQNTYEVRAVHDLPPEMVSKQIEAVADDLGIDAAKTGMLSNSAIIEEVAKTVKRYEFLLVVDPVMVAKSGAPLLRPEAIKSLKEILIPIATVVTPNRMEAERLTGVKIKSIDDAKIAAKKIVEDLGARSAVVKGGHLEGAYAVDVLYVDGDFRVFAVPRIREGCTHGTGCSFSAAIAAELAKGKSIEKAVEVAKRFVTLAIEYGSKIGRGHCPVNPSAWVDIPAERYNTLKNVEEALRLLLRYGEDIAPFVPEVQMNVVMALPARYARSLDDVAGVKGRIVRYGNTMKPAGEVDFGVSRHLARAVLKAMEFDPEVRAALNVRYDERIVEAAKKLGMVVSFYDRSEEPEEVKRREGATIPWGIEIAIKRVGSVPDLVFHRGDWGKEPMINIFARNAVEAVEKLLKIIKFMKSERGV